VLLQRCPPPLSLLMSGRPTAGRLRLGVVCSRVRVVVGHGERVLIATVRVRHHGRRKGTRLRWCKLARVYAHASMRHGRPRSIAMASTNVCSPAHPSTPPALEPPPTASSPRSPTRAHTKTV